MGYSASYVIPRFVQYAGKPDGYEPDGKNGTRRARFPDGSGSSLYYGKSHGGRVTDIMSYGSHFVMAHLVLDHAGRRRRWILNGDWWPRSGFARSNTHNTMVREAAQKSGIPWIIVPFSAMNAAGIKLDSIVPVDIAPERMWYEERTTRDLDKVPTAQRKRRVFYTTSGERLEAPRAADGTEAWPNFLGDGTTGGWHVSRRTELEGNVQIDVPGPAYEGRLHDEYEEIQRDAAGFYHYWEWRHELGESLFRATYTQYSREAGYVTRRVLFLSGFDGNEQPALYFLAELPRGAKPRTIAEAREALKPDVVADAEAGGTVVQRQGDVFAIPTDFATRDLPGPTRRSAHVLESNHAASEVRIRDGRTYARGKLYHRPRGRRGDHATQVLGDGKTWHLLVLNTVPHSYGIPRAWAISGQVD